MDNRTGITTRYSYDDSGNIGCVFVSDEGGQQGSWTSFHQYSYDNPSWLDLLTAFDGEAIAYEGQTYDPASSTVSGTVVSGNPVSYYNGRRWDFSWEKGTRLSTAVSGDTAVSYEYDINGIRKSKTVNGTTYHYVTQNGRVVRQTWNDNILDIIYDNHNAPYALCYSADGGSTYTTYYYILNLQGDVTAIIDSEGTLMGSYAYDAWGKVEEENCLYNGNGVNIIEINPIRYRGYYYDEESQLYYIAQRYYDSDVLRFINSDDAQLISDSQINNLFLYSENNPVNKQDLFGYLAVEIAIIVTGAIVGGVLGAFSAAATDGNTVESVVEGCITGAISSACGIFMPAEYAIQCALATSFFSDLIIQTVSDRKNNNRSTLDFTRAGKTALETAIGVAIPGFGKYPYKIFEGIGTIVLWADGSTLLTCVDVIFSNIIPGKQDYRYSNKRDANKWNKRRKALKNRYNGVTMKELLMYKPYKSIMVVVTMMAWMEAALLLFFFSYVYQTGLKNLFSPIENRQYTVLLIVFLCIPVIMIMGLLRLFYITIIFSEEGIIVTGTAKNAKLCTFSWQDFHYAYSIVYRLKEGMIILSDKKMNRKEIVQKIDSISSASPYANKFLMISSKNSNRNEIEMLSEIIETYIGTITPLSFFDD